MAYSLCQTLIHGGLSSRKLLPWLMSHTNTWQHLQQGAPPVVYVMHKYPPVRHKVLELLASSMRGCSTSYLTFCAPVYAAAARSFEAPTYTAESEML